MSSSITAPENIFEDEKKLIELSRRYIEIRQRLEVEKKKDPTKAAFLQIISKELNLPIDAVVELGDFAMNYLGEYEMALLEQTPRLSLDIDTGKLIEPTIE